MTARSDDKDGRRAPGAAAQLWAQLWSDRAPVSPERHCVYNAFAGLLVLALAALRLIESGHGTVLHVVVFGAIGLPLLLGPLLVKERPDTLPRLLAVDGVLFVCLATFFAGDCAVWALREPVHASFRYMPGAILFLLLYAAVQLSRPGDASPVGISRRKRLRKVALLTGIIFELIVAAALLARASRS